MSAETILGREKELADIDRFLDGDRPGALLLEGDAGIGKTTLWRESLRIAERTGPVLSSRPSEADSILSFTVLGDLLEPILEDTLDRLPSRQREAIEAALLLGPPSDAGPDPRAISLAVLGILRSLTSRGPITLAIDDVQWTDTPSARTLGFALRRLDDEPVSVVMARRTGSDPTDPFGVATTFGSRLIRHTIGPIAPLPLGRLLREHLGRRFAPPLVERIHAASGGNPFFAVEIGRALGSEGTNPPPGEPLPVPVDLPALLQRRLSSLSEGARIALLVVASTAHPTTGMVGDAAGDRSGLEEAEEARIVDVRAGAIEFTHPLLASAVYTDATPRARRDVHARLARIATDLEERARHLALSADGPDEDIAVALEEAAHQAVTRGAQSAAAELYQLAAIVTPPGDRERLRGRRTGAIGHLWAAGDVRGARILIDQLGELGPGPGRADSLYVMAIGSWNDVPRVRGFLLQALEEVGDDPATRARILGELAWTDLLSLDPASSRSRADAALEIAERIDEPDDLEPLRKALIVRALAGAIVGEETTALLGRALEREEFLTYVETGSARIALGQIQLWAGDLNAARATLEVEFDRRVDQGHETATWEVLADLAEVEHRAGGWDLAVAHAQRAIDILTEAGWSGALSEILPVQAAIAASRGDGRARDLGLEALSVCERMGDRWGEIQARAALGFAELTAGDHAACHAVLDPVVDLMDAMGVAEPGAFPFVPDEVEALVALGELEDATHAIEWLEERGRELGRPLALATAARCRGMLHGARRDLPAAEEELLLAVELHRSVPQPFELARTLLIKGEIERRSQRKRESRNSLGQALQIFDKLGARLWSERARRELERVGAVLVGSTVLTPTERRVAEFAAEGRTNRQIADAMFVTVKTVEANMSRVLHKLGIRSRKELPAALARVAESAP
jgi:DNA-binding CsgD family transcriptional regulator